MTDFLDLPIAELAALVKRGTVSAREVALASFARIEAQRSLNAFLNTGEVSTLAAADPVDRKRAAGGELGPLAGVAIDAIRCAKIALDRGVGGALYAPSSYFMKTPPEQYTDNEARRRTEAFITGEE